MFFARADWRRAGETAMPPTAGPDSLPGSAGDDTINGMGGADTIDGLGGADLLDGGEDNDTVDGGAGDDTLWGGSGQDLIRGGGDDDRISGDTGSDTIYSGAGENTINGGDGFDTIHLEAGATMKAGLTLGGADLDQLDLLGAVQVAMSGFTAAATECEAIVFNPGGALQGDGANNTIDLSGFTVAVVGGADAVLSGGGGHDRLTGSGLEDSLFGESGNDVLKGLGGDDTMVGGGGTDTLYGGDGNDNLNTVSTVGVCVGGGGDDRIYGDSGADSFSGGSGADNITGRGGLDTIDAGTGADVVSISPVDTTGVGGGAATRQGGKGDDTQTLGEGTQLAMTVFSARSSGFEAISLDQLASVLATAADNLFDFSGFAVAGAALVVNAGAGADTITGTANADELNGQGGADRLEGGGGDDVLQGGLHDDRLFGGGGGDTLSGGGGADVLAGGAGATRFMFQVTYDSLTSSMDRVLDFNLADGDRIDVVAIDADVYTTADQSFALVSAFTGAAGQAVLAYNATKDWTRLTLDVNGDAIADFDLRVDGELTAAGLVL